MSPKARRIAIALAVVLVGAELAWLVHAQTPRVYYDTQVYFQAAAQPLGLGRLFLGKPAFVPIIYTMTGPSPGVIATVQAVVAFLAWSALAAALVTSLRGPRARVLAGVACAAFLLAAPRVGYASAILSESLDDSLAALLLASVIVLARKPAAWPAVAAVALAWIFTRDSNAPAALIAVGAAMIVWPVRRWWREARWAVALAAVVSLGAVVSLYSTRVAPPPLPYQASWNPALTARGTYPMIDNILWRVLATDRAWLAARGAPVDELARFTEIDHALQARPEDAGFQAWLLAHGQGTYVRWLVRHPLDRAAELARAWDTVLAGNHRPMMPAGHVTRQLAPLDALRGLTTNRWLALALLLAAPWLARRPRASALTGIAVCAIASGLVGAAASYFGDAAEYDRHCYGAGQQIVIGCVLALLAYLDLRAPGSRSRRPDPSPAAP